MIFLTDLSSKVWFSPADGTSSGRFVRGFKSFLPFLFLLLSAVVASEPECFAATAALLHLKYNFYSFHPFIHLKENMHNSAHVFFLVQFPFFLEASIFNAFLKICGNLKIGNVRKQKVRDSLCGRIYFYVFMEQSAGNWSYWWSWNKME